MNNERFKVIWLKQAGEFLNSLDEKVQNKILYDIDKAKREPNDRVFSKLENSDGIWEFRTDLRNIEYRILAFWDKRKRALVIATNGFVKKSQRTPSKEIKKAQQLRRLYYEE